MYIYVPQKIFENAILKSQRGKQKKPKNKNKNKGSDQNRHIKKGIYYEERY